MLVVLLLVAGVKATNGLFGSNSTPAVSQETNTQVVSWYDTMCQTVTGLQKVTSKKPDSTPKPVPEVKAEVSKIYDDQATALDSAAEVFLHKVQVPTFDPSWKVANAKLVVLLQDTAQQSRDKSAAVKAVGDTDSAGLQKLFEQQAKDSEKSQTEYATRWSEAVKAGVIPNQNTRTALSKLPSCKPVFSASGASSSSAPPSK